MPQDSAPEAIARSLTVRTVSLTTSVQTLTSFAVVVFSVLAPVAARDFDVPAASPGALISVVFFSATFSGLASGAFTARFGPVGTLRGSVALVCLAFLLGAGGTLGLAIVFSAIAGFAHGTVNPASSMVLAKAVPAHQRSLMFSIKQTGVPMGIAIAGVVLPAMVQVMSWRQALLLLSVVALLFIPMLTPFSRIFDAERRRDHPIAFAGVGDSFRLIFANARLRQLAIASTVFAFVQLVVNTFLVTYLHLELEFSLATSGMVLSVTSLASVFARIFWGWVADRTGRPRHVLATLGVLMGLGCIGGGLFSQAWPIGAVLAIGVLWGISAIAWNGVLLAEVAHLSPEGRIASVTSGIQAVLFLGSIFGPLIFGAFAHAVGGFGLGFLLVAPFPIICGIWMIFSRPRV